MSATARYARSGRRRRLRQVVGDRVADHEVEQGDQRRRDQGAAEDGEVDVVPAFRIARKAEQEIAVVGERPDVLRATLLRRRQIVAQREVDHHQLRQDDQDQHPEAHRDHDVGGQHPAVAVEEAAAPTRSPARRLLLLGELAGRQGHGLARIEADRQLGAGTGRPIGAAG